VTATTIRGMFTRIATFVVRRPWQVIAAWLVAIALVAGLSPVVDDVVNQDDTSFVPDSYESAKADKLEKQAFPASSAGTSLLVFKRQDGARLTAQDRRSIDHVVAKLNAARVHDVAGIRTGPQGLSPKGDTQLAFVGFTGANSDDRVKDASQELSTKVTAAVTGTDLRAGQTGGAAVQHDFHQALDDAERIVSIATIILIIGLMALVFRSPIAALFPILVVGAVAQFANGVIADSAKLFGYQVDSTLPILLVVVLFGIGTDYILFVLFRYRERLLAGDDPREAVVFAVSRVGEAVASSALVVVAAFATLGLSSLESNQTLGPSLAIAVLCMLAAAVTLVPAVLSLLGRRVFWPSSGAELRVERAISTRHARDLRRHPGVLAAVALVVLLVVSVGMGSFKTNYDMFANVPSDKPSKQAYEDLKASFPAGAVDPVKVIVHSQRPLTRTQLAAVAQRVDRVDGVGAVTAPELSPDRRTARLQALLDVVPNDSKGLDLVEGPVRDAAHEAQRAGIQVLTGGTPASNVDLRKANGHDQKIVYPVAAALIAIILAVLLRSAVAPFLLLASVGLGYLATLGATALVFQELGGEPGLSWKLQLLVYLFVVAIGTDYNILMTARLREEVKDGASTRAGVALAARAAGPTVNAAGFILSATFASMLLCGVSSMMQIGFAVGIGIMFSGLFLGSALIPALSALLGDRLWWPSRPRNRMIRAQPVPGEG
jgi:putative drug exporter of the RND superfamily